MTLERRALLDDQLDCGRTQIAVPHWLDDANEWIERE